MKVSTTLAFVAGGVTIITALLPVQDSSAAQKTASRYTITDLGPLSKRTADDKPGLNANGEIAAWKAQGDNLFHADLIRGANETDLGGLPGFENTFAADMNNKEMIVGVAQDRNDMRFTHAFFWHDGRMEDLPTLGGKYADARGINQQGDIAGKTQLPDNATMHATLWSHGKVKDLGTLSQGHFSEA